MCTTHPLFQERLDILFERLPGLGYSSLCRLFDEQAELYRCYLCDCCNDGNLANPPGYSQHEPSEPHGHSLAVDLKRGPYSWSEVHAEAANVGIIFPIPSELWHAQPEELPSGRKTGPSAIPPAPFDRPLSTPEDELMAAKDEIITRVDKHLDAMNQEQKDFTVEILLKVQAHLDGHLDSIYKDINGRLSALEKGTK